MPAPRTNTALAAALAALPGVTHAAVIDTGGDCTAIEVTIPGRDPVVVHDGAYHAPLDDEQGHCTHALYADVDDASGDGPLLYLAQPDQLTRSPGNDSVADDGCDAIDAHLERLIEAVARYVTTGVTC